MFSSLQSHYQSKKAIIKMYNLAAQQPQTFTSWEEQKIHFYKLIQYTRKEVDKLELFLVNHNIQSKFYLTNQAYQIPSLADIYNKPLILSYNKNEQIKIIFEIKYYLQKLIGVLKYLVAKVFLTQKKRWVLIVPQQKIMGCCPPVQNRVSPSLIQRRDLKIQKIGARVSKSKTYQEERVEKIEFEVSQSDKQMLDQTISSHEFLYRLPMNERNRLIQCFDFYKCEQGVDIFKKDDHASLFFIIKKGRVRVTVNEQKKEQYRILGRGDYFGDLALLYAAPRSATVSALEYCQFFCISHQIFRRTAQQIVKKNYQLAKKFIEKVMIFKFLTKKQKTLVTYNTLVLRYEKGAIIFREGDDANSFYIVTSGKIQLKIPDKPPLEMSIGQSFGQNSFQQKQYRSGTAIALQKTSLLSIGRQSLKKCLGNQLQDISYYNILKWSLSRDPIFQIASKIQRQKLIVSTQINYERQGKIIYDEGQTAKYLIISLQEKINNEQIGTIFNKEYLLAQNQNDLKITKKIVKDKAGNIGRISFDIITAIFGPKLAGLVNKTISKEALLQFSHKKSQYINSLSLDNFTAKFKLGQGQYGKVYLVQDKLRKKYAMKCIQKKQIIETKMESFVLKEKQILKMIDSPFIVRLYRTFSDEHFVYFLINMISGADFFDLLREIGLCNKKKAQFYVGCLTLALEHLHQRNIIYRDLKPENAVMDESGYLHLIDLGIAKILTQQSGYRTFTVIGTPHYMSPEVVQLQGYTFSSDFWSLGVVLYQMLCGQLPYGNTLTDPYQIFKQIFAKQIEFPKFYNDEAGKQLLKKLLSKNPSDRFFQEFSRLKKFDFFSNFDWEALSKRQMSAPLQIKPKLNNNHINQLLVNYLKKQKANLGSPVESSLKGWDQNF